MSVVGEFEARPFAKRASIALALTYQSFSADERQSL
jgi:hypothetical protein